MQDSIKIGISAIIAAGILAIGLVLAAEQTHPRYALSNPGGGITMRLDSKTGDLIGCRQLACDAIVKDGKALAVKDRFAEFRDAPSSAH